MINSLFPFLKEVRVEAKRVNWPTRQETLKNTLIVIGFSVVVALLLGAFDFVFTQLLDRFLI